MEYPLGNIYRIKYKYKINTRHKADYVLLWFAFSPGEIKIGRDRFAFGGSGRVESSPAPPLPEKNDSFLLSQGRREIHLKDYRLKSNLRVANPLEGNHKFITYSWARQ